jgi:hypothetical protein
MMQGGTSTNDLGEFRLHSLRPGKYVISATYQSRDMFVMMPERVVGSPQAIQAADEGYATTYYPNAMNPDSASVLEITPGAQISGINITLVRIHTVRVKGHVNIGAAIGARRNINVMLNPRDNTIGFGMPRAIARVIDDKGNFEMRGVAPGSYILRANHNEDNRQYTARMPLEVGSSNIEGLELELQPPAEMEGRVVVEANGDLKGARINISLQPKAPGQMGGSGGPIRDDQTFKLNNVGLDAYDVGVFGLPEGFYLKSVRLGQQDVTETGVDFSQGVSAEQFTVVLNPNGGQIDGAVQNAKGDAAIGATVTLIPDQAHRSISWMYKTANTDQNGRFTIKGVRPGDYKVYAWEDIEPGAQQDPDFIKPHESAGEAVSVKEGSHENVQLKVVAADNNTNQQAAR